MYPHLSKIPRRTFLVGALSASALATTGTGLLAADTEKPRHKICAFVKFLQTLTHDQLAETIAEMGFDGIEATIRDRGQVLPERVEEELPKLVEALKKHKLEITVMASSVNSIDQPHTEKVLQTAAALGVKRYRLKNYYYDLKRPVAGQLADFAARLKDLIALNRELGLSAVYQNHSGERYLGASIWDLERLMRPYQADEFGIAFDIRHATVEAGLSWPTLFNLSQPHLAAVYVKDFVWDGNRPKNVPLGKGRVQKRFFQLLRQSPFRGPISLHVEYLHGAGVKANTQALRDDLKTLRKLLNA